VFVGGIPIGNAVGATVGDIIGETLGAFVGVLDGNGVVGVLVG
jgi:hypothetical protein